MELGHTAKKIVIITSFLLVANFVGNIWIILGFLHLQKLFKNLV